MSNFRKRNHGLRVAGVILTLTMALTMLPGFSLTAFAGESGGAVNAAAPLAGGYGSNGKFLAPIAPYATGATPISTPAQLAAIANNLSGNFYLTNNIDLSGAGWTPIGTDISSAFSGTFDGQGYVISNMTISGQCLNAGLFGSVRNATIENVGIEGASIIVTLDGDINAGGVCGSCDFSTLNNCYNTGNISSSSASFGSYTGGICGKSYGSINNCYNSGNVSAPSSSATAFIGGICGYCGYESGSSGAVANCYNTGTVNSSDMGGGICGLSDSGSVSGCYNMGMVSSVSSSARASAGGICGSNSSSGYAYEAISDCYNTGYISASGHWSVASGICGSSQSSGNINNCYNTGNVNSSGAIATATGILGGASGTNYDFSTLSNCYNIGNISSSSSAGGISAGLCDIHNCYNTGNVSALYSAGGVCDGCSPGSTVSNCYNTGNVTTTAVSPSTGSSLTGGVCSICNGAINNCYNVGMVSASIGKTSYIGGICGDSGGVVTNCYALNLYGSTYGKLLTLAQMRAASNLVGFDFTSVWAISSSINNGFPYLQGMTVANWTYVSPTDLVTNFVTRFYQLCLNRAPDAGGLNNWVSQLQSKTKTGADVANGFVFSPEFKNRNVGNADYVTIMYKAFFNRTPDTAGYNNWLGKLNMGLSRYYVLSGFVNSAEFRTLCASYGINPGTLALTNPADKYPNTALFVGRFYQTCLGRTADWAGLNNWVTDLQTKTKTGADVAKGFVFSKEFVNKKVSNADYVTILYKAFFNRTPDTAGYNNWLGKLNGGMSRLTVLAGFVNSVEFRNLCASYGINPGSLAA